MIGFWFAQTGPTSLPAGMAGAGLRSEPRSGASWGVMASSEEFVRVEQVVLRQLSAVRKSRNCDQGCHRNAAISEILDCFPQMFSKWAGHRGGLLKHVSNTACDGARAIRQPCPVYAAFLRFETALGTDSCCCERLLPEFSWLQMRVSRDCPALLVIPPTVFRITFISRTTCR